MQTEQVPCQTAAHSNLRIYSGTGKAADNTKATVQNGDAFTAIFQMLAQSLQTGSASSKTAINGLLQTAGPGVQQTGGVAVGKGKTLREQLAGAMLVQNPQLLSFLQADDKTAQQMLTALKLPPDVQQMLMNLRPNLLAMMQQNGTTAAASPAVQPSAVQEPAVQQSAGAPTTGTAGQSDTQKQLSGQSGATGKTEVVSSTGQSSGSTAEDKISLQLGNQFQQSVRAAKKLMDSTQKPQNQNEKTAVDVDALQSHVQTVRPEINAESLKATGQMHEQTAGLTSQIKTGIADNLLQGKQEFVIKLQPDGLGEITVRLSENAGEATMLHLQTANAETAKLINNDLNSLRDAMKPLQIVVESAQPQQTENGTAQNGSQQQSLQQFSMMNQQQHHFGGRQHGQHVFSFQPETENESSAQEVETQPADSALDSYI